MATARDSAYDERIYRIVAPLGTPDWLRVSTPPGISWATVHGERARKENQDLHPLWFVEALMPAPGLMWRDIVELYYNDPEYLERAHGHFGESFVEQITGQPDPEYPQSDPVQGALNLYETTASSILARAGLQTPGRFGASIGTMPFDHNVAKMTLERVTILYRGSPVWLYDIERSQPDRVCTLWELVQVGARPDPNHAKYGPSVVFKREGYLEERTESKPLLVRKAWKPKKAIKLWLMSEDQWNEGEWPPESQGGPPYSYGMSSAREAGEARDYIDPATGAWKEEYAIAPRFAPEWLRWDGEAATWPTQNQWTGSEYVVKPIVEAGEEPDIVEITLPPFDSPEIAQLYPHSEITSGEAEKRFREHLLWPGAVRSGYKRDDSYKGREWRTILPAINVQHEGSPVGWYDMDNGFVRYATLWDLAHLKQGVPQEDVERVERFTEFERQTETRVPMTGPLWLLSQAQWDNAEFPPPIKGGPPFARGVTAASEEHAPAREAREQRSDERRLAVAPRATPEWLLTRAHIHGQKESAKRFIEIDATGMLAQREEDDPAFGTSTLLPWIVNLAERIESTQEIYRRSCPNKYGHIDTPGDQKLLQEIQVRHNGSPVWWVDLDEGPVQAVSLWDVACTKQPWNGNWMMSLDQWDNAEYPPESQGGPPHSGASIGREASEAEKEERLDQEWAYAPKGTPKWLLRRKHAKKQKTIEIDAQGLVDWTEDYYRTAHLTGEQAEKMSFDWVKSNLHWPIPAETTYKVARSRHHEMLSAIQLRHRGSPVWWTEVNDGPVQAATLYDLTQGYGTGPMRAFHLEGHPWLYMLSLDQWDRAEWPAESEGGPPYTPHVSVAREAREQHEFDEKLITIVAPLGTPKWLQTYGEGFRVQARVPPPGPAWEEVFRHRGWDFDLKKWRRRSGQHVQRTGVPAERDVVEQISSEFIEQLHASHSGKFPYRADRWYDDATRILTKTTEGPYKATGAAPVVGPFYGYHVRGLPAVQALFSTVTITHHGSTVWLADFKKMKLDRVLTLWELLMFGDPTWEVSTAGTSPQGNFVYDDRIGYLKLGKKTLWPVSEKQWEEGEFAPPAEGGPEHVPGMFEAGEAKVKKKREPKKLDIDNEEDVMNEMAKALDVDVNELAIYPGNRYGNYDGSTGTIWQVDLGGQEYFVVADDTVARDLAIELVKRDLEESPENFNQDFIARHIDTKKLAEALRPDVLERTRENLQESDSYDFWSNAENAKIVMYIPEEDEDGERRDPTSEEIDALAEDMTDEELSDPMRYLEDTHGEKGQATKFAIEIAGIDVDAAAKEAVRDDGAGNFLRTYDGETHETPGGFTYWREG